MSGGGGGELPELLSATVGTVVYLADNRGVLAGFVFEDTLRAGAAEAVAELRKLGIEVQLLSGDAERPVQQMATTLGIAIAEARLKPADKLVRLQALQAQGAVVAMIGDGVNDAPVLAAAQVSLAMGSGTQLAAAASDMVLLSERLTHLAPAVLMARRTLSVIRQNLAWSLIYNLLAVPLAAMGWIAPWMAAIGMSASSLLVVANALRLREPPGVTAQSAPPQ
jgi:Cu2+-exporting ATPase